MKLVNLNNTFTVFGAFCVFDEDYMPLYSERFSDCKIYTDPDNSPNNLSKKILRIVDSKNHMTIILRPTRLDIQIAGHDRKLKDTVIKQAMEAFLKLDDIYEHPLANRIAYVSNDFAFDDYGDLASNIVKNTNLLPVNESASDVAIRINNQKAIVNEVFNVVQSINNVMISKTQVEGEQRRALMVAFDINTLINNQEERFKFSDLELYFNAIFDEATSRLSHIDDIVTNKTI